MLIWGCYLSRSTNWDLIGVQGKDSKTARLILEDALILEEAGVSLLVLECIPTVLADEITQALNIPTIGIGAGANCDGQVLVLYDMLGISIGGSPKFSKNFMPDTGARDGCGEGLCRGGTTRRFSQGRTQFLTKKDNSWKPPNPSMRYERLLNAGVIQAIALRLFPQWGICTMVTSSL